MKVALTPFRTFVFAAVSAFLGGMAFLYFVTSMDFPNSTTWELLKYSLLPPLPAALICGAISRHSIHREQRVDELEWPVRRLLIVGFLSAGSAVVITIVGATLLGVLGWVFATPP
jgi:hypothetical protein